MSKKVILVILDGWGITQDPAVSALAQANTPYMDGLLKNYPHASLRTDGLYVGLPEGQMGNSEVGHMNLGAGRVIYQDLVKINNAIKDGSIAEVKALKDAFSYAKKHHKKVHFMGLVSDGGVHSHIDHLIGLVKACDHAGLSSYVHAFTDGRDVDPHSGKDLLTDLTKHLTAHNSQLATVIGRYYAMDRDKRWERVKKAYDLMCNGIGKPSQHIVDTIQSYYDKNISDEFMEPIVMVDNQSNPIAKIAPDDVVVFFNFRTDRGRQLTEALTQDKFPAFDMHPIKLHFVTLTNYNDTYKDIAVIYPKEDLSETLGEVLESHGKKQIRIAETEKYPHVTFFFSGGREKEFVGEKRLMCPSPKVATYDLKPEMSAEDITNAILPELDKREADFICLNFANTDMVGHTGDMKAAIKAAETVDGCLERVINSAIDNQYTGIIIADHGNSETMINKDGSPNTAHTINPVPIILVDKEIKSIKSGILANIAPTVLDLLDIDKPDIMNEKTLI